VKFVFATTEADKMLETIVSRCQRLEFQPIPEGLIAERLEAIVKADGVKADREALLAIARLAQGGMRDSQSILDQIIAFAGKKVAEKDVLDIYGLASARQLQDLAAALARILADRGRPDRVGLMDCDVYGPSVPLMLGVRSRPEIEGEVLLPPANFGVRAISMGLLVGEDAPVIWRGPMVMKTISQFASNVRWGELDVLLVDLPPGTGDAQLSIAQSMALSGALVVTTPQAAAVSVALRGAAMFGQVKVPLLGVIENMSYFADDQGRRQHLFGQGGGQRAAAQLGAEFLGEIPLDPAVRQGGDHGIPVVVSHPDALAARAFHALALRLLQILGQ